MKKERVHTCFVTKEQKPQQDLVRFVCSLDGEVFLDFSEKLPGAGVWVSREKEMLEQFLGFSEDELSGVFGVSKVIKPDIEVFRSIVSQKILSLLGFVKKSGKGVFGDHEVRKALRDIKILFVASDAGKNTQKVAETFKERGGLVLSIFSKEQLETACGVPYCSLVGVTSLDFFKETLHKYGDFVM